MVDTLFDILDSDQDGLLSRSDIQHSAARLGWHWREAPLLAVLDLLTVRKPLAPEQFARCMGEIAEDPLGPYGRVLLNSALFDPACDPAVEAFSGEKSTTIGATERIDSVEGPGKGLAEELARIEGENTADSYRRLIASLEPVEISSETASLLIIDPQKSFTRGAWMESIGFRGEVDVTPIRHALAACARVLEKNSIQTMFSRCPFPPGSYDWDNRLAGILDPRQLYVIKPGNSILFPPLNGFREWVGQCIDAGKRTLVIGGCTVNSCVRVSSMEIRERFSGEDLEVVVDMSLCGGRARNYSPADIYGGLSAVESAVRQMTDGGVRVVRQVDLFG